MKTVEFIRTLIAKGMSVDDALDLAEPFEDNAVAALSSVRPEMNALEKRRAWDRERKAKKKDAGNSTGIPPEPCDAQFHRNSTGIPPENDALAHVRDNILPTEITGLAVAVVEARDERAIDDWPNGRADDWAAALIAICETPRLDLNKSPGLITTIASLPRWKAAGASWEHDVVPTVRGMVRKRGPPIGTWKYFDAAVAQAIADNRQALQIPEAQNVRHFPKQSDRDDRLGRMLAGAMAAADGGG